VVYWSVRRAVRPRAQNSNGQRLMTAIDDSTVLERLGGEEAVRRWVDLFYTAVQADEVLAPLFPDDLTESREKQFAFFVQMLGGRPLYQERYGHPFLRYKHRKIAIGVPERDAWMRRVTESLRAVSADQEVVAYIERRLAPIADHMINHHPERKDAQFFN
jgi:hemoglobin